jgi:glycosyltransferase involved in cell wall biosynthesis
MELSVVIPAYNAAGTIGACLASVLADDGVDPEVVVVDDGSTDGTAEIARGFGDRVVVEEGDHQGAAAARNRGLRRAGGRWVKFLDADDALVPGALARQLEEARALGAHARKVVYGDALWVDARDRPLGGPRPAPRRPGEDPVLHILTQSPLTSCPLHRRDLLEEVGGFDEGLTKGQEHDLHLRLVLAGVELVHRPGWVYRYRNDTSGQRISARFVKNGRPLEHLETIRRHCALIRTARGGLSRPVRRALGRRLWSLGRAVLREGHPEAAREYFEEARGLAGSLAVSGRMPYPPLAWTVGAERAERSMEALRRWRERLR